MLLYRHVFVHRSTKNTWLRLFHEGPVIANHRRWYFHRQQSMELHLMAFSMLPLWATLPISKTPRLSVTSEPTTDSIAFPFAQCERTNEPGADSPDHTCVILFPNTVGI